MRIDVKQWRRRRRNAGWVNNQSPAELYGDVHDVSADVNQSHAVTISNQRQQRRQLQQQQQQQFKP